MKKENDKGTRRWKKKRLLTVPAARDDVRCRANRCPFCLEDVQTEDDVALVCARCLTRHHRPCWAEARSCLICGGKRVMRRRPKTGLSTKEPALRILAVGLGVSLLVIGLAVFTYDRSGANQDELQQAAVALEEQRQATRSEADRLSQLERRRDEVELPGRVDCTPDPAVERAWKAEKEAWRAKQETIRERERVAEREKLRQRDLRRQVNRLLNDALAHVEGERYAEAQRAYAQALELDPHNVTALRSCAVVRVRAEDYTGAISFCDRALTQAKPDRVEQVELLITRGTARRLRGDADMAVKDFDAAIAIDPHHTSALNNRGVTRALLGKLEPARADYDRVLELDPRCASAYLNRAQVRVRLRDLEGAVSDYVFFLGLVDDAHPQKARVKAEVRRLGDAINRQRRAAAKAKQSS